MILFVAQGFGVGRIPFAPGTFGSVVGMLWMTLLLAIGSFWCYLAALFGSAALSVWLCGEAERILGKPDPGSVVLDEIVAIPLCFLAWILAHLQHSGSMPAPAEFLGGGGWAYTLATFVAFRFFDIAKPWPVHQSQRLPGGWGVTMDDLLAALWVNLALFVFLPS